MIEVMISAVLVLDLLKFFFKSINDNKDYYYYNFFKVDVQQAY